MYAGDEATYTVFAPLLDRIIEDYHHVSPVWDLLGALNWASIRILRGVLRHSRSSLIVAHRLFRAPVTQLDRFLASDRRARVRHGLLKALWLG